jgi:hypothetical protein
VELRGSSILPPTAGTAVKDGGGPFGNGPAAGVGPEGTEGTEGAADAGAREEAGVSHPAGDGAGPWDPAVILALFLRTISYFGFTKKMRKAGSRPQSRKRQQ